MMVFYPRDVSGQPSQRDSQGFVGVIRDSANPSEQTHRLKSKRRRAVARVPGQGGPPVPADRPHLFGVTARTRNCRRENNTRPCSQNRGFRGRDVPTNVHSCCCFPAYRAACSRRCLAEAGGPEGGCPRMPAGSRPQEQESGHLGVHGEVPHRRRRAERAWKLR